MRSGYTDNPRRLIIVSKGIYNDIRANHYDQIRINKTELRFSTNQNETQLCNSLSQKLITSQSSHVAHER